MEKDRRFVLAKRPRGTQSMYAGRRSPKHLVVDPDSHQQAPVATEVAIEVVLEVDPRTLERPRHERICADDAGHTIDCR